MAKSSEISQIEEINKGLSTLNTTLNSLSETYLKIVKDISNSNKPIKDAAVSMEQYAKAQKQSTEDGKRLTAAHKEEAAVTAKLTDAEEKKLKVIAASRLELQKQNELRKAQVASDKAAAGSIEKLTAENKKLYIEQRRLNLETAEGIKRNKEINATINKNTDTIKVNSSELVKHRINVGNYPQITQAAAGGFNELTSAVGGTTGAIGNAATGMVTAGGAAGVFTAVVAALAAAWKYANESVKLYLESADKALYGGSGFNQDAKAAMEDAAKRAKGGIIEGRRLEAEAKNRLLLMQNITEEDKAQLQLQISEGLKMQEDNQLLLNSMGKNKEVGISLKKQLEWKLAYRTLLKEEEILNDEKLAKETEWEALEARLVEQRHVYNDVSATIAEREAARVEALRIADVLGKTKLSHLDMEIANMEQLSIMTGTQEVVEDKLNGLRRERNTIDKEYFQDLVKIDRFLKDIAKVETKAIVEKKSEEIDLQSLKDKNAKESPKRIETEQKQSLNILREYTGLSQEEIDKRVEAEKKADDEILENKERLKDMQLQLASEAINGIFDLNAAKLSNEMQSLEKEKDLKLSNKRLTESQKEKIEAEYEKKGNVIKTKQAKADKLQALFNIALDTARGIMSAMAGVATIPLVPWISAMGLVQAGMVAAQPIPKYAKGTQSAGERGIFGEAGREIMFTRSGDIMLADKATFFEGNKFKGAQILSNPETEKLISMTDRKGGGSDNRLIAELRSVNCELVSVRKAIQNKPVAIYDKENKVIGQATSQSQTIYLNRLLRK